MKKERIVKKLFRSYALLFMLFYFFSVIVAVLFISKDINANIIDTQKQMVQTISSSIEMYFKDINNFSLELLNSSVFKQAVIQDLPLACDTGSDQTQPLKRVYEASYKMFERGYRVGVFTNSGHYIWLGDNIVVQKIDNTPTTYADYNRAGKAEVRRIERNAFLDALPKDKQKTLTNESTITLARSINLKNLFAQPQAMLEVQVSTKDFDRFINSINLGTNAESMSIHIFGSDGSLLYGNANSLPAIQINLTENGSFKTQGNIIQNTKILNNEISIVYTIPSSVYYKKLTSFILLAFVFSVAMGAVVMLVTYRLSFALSKPLKDMSNQLEKIQLGDKFIPQKVQTEIYELDVMAQTVEDLNAKLVASLDDVVALKTAGLQSRLMALQSQMQPHFLHNTLAVIGALSEQGNFASVSRMCSNLSHMLRYVSSKEETGVMLYEEVRLLNCYIEIMRERFQGAQATINIPIEMMQICVPKLILQPLAENSFKYAAKIDTKICINGQIDGDKWFITVTDNGDGFNQEKIDEIIAKCKDVESRQDALSTQIDGMGLVNIYARLSLFYADNFIFKIEPNAGITIGGSMRFEPDKQN